eukprot:3461807-Amphidinium_carterae.1
MKLRNCSTHNRALDHCQTCTHIVEHCRACQSACKSAGTSSSESCGVGVGTRSHTSHTLAAQFI